MSCPVSGRRLLILVEESLEGAVVGGDSRALGGPLLDELNTHPRR